MSEDNASNPIDPQYISESQKLQEQIAEYKKFLDDMDAKQKELTHSFAAYQTTKARLDNIAQAFEDHEQTRQDDAEQANNFITDLRAKAEESVSLIVQIKDSARSIGETKIKAESDIESLEAAKIRFNDLKEKSNELSASLESQTTDIQESLKRINAEISNFDQKTKELDDLLIASQSSKDNIAQIETYASSLAEQATNKLNSTSNVLAELEAKQAETQEKFQEIEDQFEEIDANYTRIIVGNSDPANGPVEKSVSAQFDELLEKMKADRTSSSTFYDQKTQEFQKYHDDTSGNFAALHKQTVEKFDALYNELNTKINSLLPGAGAAGLASSYFQAKMRYATSNDITLTDDANDISNRMKLDKSDFLPQWASYLFNLFLFLAPLWVLFNSFQDFEYPEIFNNQPYAALFYKLTLTLPLVAVSTYGIVSLVADKKMYEAYNHKQRVMQLYHSFKEQIDQSNDQALKAKLLDVMLDVVKDKPDYKPNKTDRTVARLIDTLQKPIDKIADKILGNS